MNAYRIKELMWLVIILLFIIIAMSGCSTQSYRMITPAETANIPVDCFNRKAITEYLETQKNYKPTTEREYEQVNAVKYKIWQIRSTCQSG